MGNMSLWKIMKSLAVPSQEKATNHNKWAQMDIIRWIIVERASESRNFLIIASIFFVN